MVNNSNNISQITLHIKQATTYSAGNPGSSLGQAYKCSEVKLQIIRKVVSIV